MALMMILSLWSVHLFSFFIFPSSFRDPLGSFLYTHAVQVFSLILHILGHYIYQSIYHQIMLLELGYCKMGGNMLCLFFIFIVFFLLCSMALAWQVGRLG